jgi:hypothetical protein
MDIIVKNDKEFQILIKALDPFQKGDVFEMERNLFTQLKWITEIKEYK